MKCLYFKTQLKYPASYSEDKKEFNKTSTIFLTISESTNDKGLLYSYFNNREKQVKIKFQISELTVEVETVEH